MNCVQNKMSPYERARRWLCMEKAIFEGAITGENDFDLFVPVEARELSSTMMKRGIPPHFTDNHLMLWAALTEAMGIDEFVAPLGWEKEDIEKHVLGCRL